MPSGDPKRSPAAAADPKRSLTASGGGVRAGRALFAKLIFRPLRRDPARTLLTLVSIALGVAVVIAIDLAGDAAAGSFESSLTTLVGRVDYEITANGSVDENYLAALAALPGSRPFVVVGLAHYTGA